MSYNQKPPGSSGSGMSGGPPNGPNNMPQVAKTFAGIQQQMQNLVHGQNAIPQSSQADINAFLQQQRIQNMLKQQQQFLQFQHQMQQQQHQQQQHQHHNMGGGGSVGAGSVGATGVGSSASSGASGAGGSGEPLALTRTPGAAELLNKTYQQQANGNPATNATFNQLQQTLQALPTNFVQQLQVFQYQMQAKQMQQQQHGGGQAQHGHGQQQPVQSVPPTPPTTTAMSHQQQQQQQKHQNQHQQQQQNALSRYLTAAAAQVAVVSGNKMSSATPPPPPPLTNQMKPPNLPPNTQITPVAASNIGSGNLSVGPHSKMPAGNANTGSAKHQAPPPSISLTPSKSTTSGPCVAHQQNKFTPPINTGGKGGHLGHSGLSQNLPKSTHGANTTTSNTTTSPNKTSTNADVTVAALKSPQSTPVQLTKQVPPTATTAVVGNKSVANTTITTGSTSAMVSPLKSTTPTTTVTSNATNTAANMPAVQPITAPTAIAAANISQSKPSAVKPAIDDLVATKIPMKSVNVEKEKEVPKTTLTTNDSIKITADSSASSSTDSSNKKESEKQLKEKKLESTAVNKAAVMPSVAMECGEKVHKSSNDLKTNSAATATEESKVTEDKVENSAKSNKIEQLDVGGDSEKKSLDVKKPADKNKIVEEEEKSIAPVTTVTQISLKKTETLPNDKKGSDDLKSVNDEKNADCKEEISEKENKIKTTKPSKIEEEIVASKEVSKSETETENSNTAIEKSSKSPTPTTAKPNEKGEANTKISLDATNKKEKFENVQHKIEENESNAPTPVKVESTTAILSSVTTENGKETVSREKEEQVKSSKSSEKAESGISSKSTPTLTATKKINSEESIKDPNEVTEKETEAVVAAPIKKVGRLAKGAKSKPVALQTPVENKTPELQEEKPVATNSRVKRKPKVDNTVVSESAPATPKEDDPDRKSKRHRLKTILYQSPLPELAYITKLSASEASNSPKPMSNEDRLIVFYKNEYMAVRNAEGTFYLCQTMQNVYRTSPRISIRWLSEDAKDNSVFIPDFYDHTDIECVLTTVELKRIDKGHLRLPKAERSRIESILKKAIDVEKGLVPRPELTEENPDGLDISLFKDESQIEKRSALTDGNDTQTPSSAAGRKSRRSNTVSASSTRKSSAAGASLTSAGGSKRRRGGNSTASTSSSSRKSLSKKRKTLVKRKKKLDNSDEDEDEETSDDYESDTEYKPTQKRSSVSASGSSKTVPRAQRSPLAKARAASPITPTTSRSKNIPQKSTPTPSTSKASRGERAAKRKSITDAGSSEEALTPVKKPMTTSNTNNKNKASDKVSCETATPVKKSSSLIDSSSS